MVLHIQNFHHCCVCFDSGVFVQSFFKIYRSLRLVHIEMATATETQYFSLHEWVGVEPNETVHMVNDGNGNSNGIVGKWLWTHFVMQWQQKETHIQLYYCHCHCHQSPCEQSHLIPHNQFSFCCH